MLLTTALAGVLLGAPDQQAQPTARPQQQPAAQRPAGEPEPVDLGVINVTGQRLRGSADTDIPPDVTLSGEQIQAYGASSIAELLTYLEPLTRSSQGRAGGQPVILVNGRRISGFREIAGLPPEAIERTEILPEEVALRYGYSADQRVVNFVLKQDFRSASSQVTAGGPTEGGRSNVQLDGGMVTIDRANRWNVDVELQRQTALYETERDVVRTPPADSIARTLLPDTSRAQVRGAFKRDLDQNTQGTLSYSLESTESQSFLGLTGAAPNSPARGRSSESLNGQLGVLLDGYWGDDWRWNTNLNYTRVESDTQTDQLGGLAPDVTNSISQTLGAELVLNGDVYELPAGDVSTTFRFSADQVSLDSRSTRLGVTTERDQSRETVAGSGNFNIPIARRDREVLSSLGNLSLNANLGWRELSDFGSLRSLGLSTNWSPIEPLSLIASWTNEQGAPSVSQLNDPILFTPNVPVFDPRTGQTVAVTQITGGNPNLDADERNVWKLGFNLRPLENQDLQFSSTWTRERVENAFSSFPTITASLEQALPGRFVRDGGGNLVSIDTRPLNFERTERQDIRTGFNFSRAFGTPTPQPQGQGQGQGQGGGFRGGPVIMMGPGPGGGGGGGGQAGPGGGGGPQFRMGGGGRGGGMQPGQGRFNISLYHTYRIQDEVLIAQGLPVFDQLEGQTVSGRTGQPGHEVQLQGGVFRNGFGSFVQANWNAATRIEGGTGPDLRFSPRTVVNLNLFADLNQRKQLIEDYPWLRGTRISLQIRNLFDEDIRVTSSAGATPVNYQSDFLDPTGRAVQIQIRKILF